MYYAIAGFLLIFIAGFFLLKDSTGGNGDTNNPSTDTETPEEFAERIRQGYYDDLFDRGNQWEEAAAEFLTRTEGMIDTEEIRSIYKEIYNQYAGQPTPVEYQEYKCEVDNKTFKGLSTFQEHVQTHTLPTLNQIQTEMNYVKLNEYRNILEAYMDAEYPGITESEWKTLWVQHSRRNFYLVLYYKTDDKADYTSWRPRAEEYWQRSEGLTSHTDLYNLYIAIIAMGPKAMPAPTAATIDEQLASIVDALDDKYPVWVLRSGTWLAWHPKDPGSDLKEIKAGEAASIYVTRDITLSYNGHTYQLKQGWNNIGWQG